MRISSQLPLYTLIAVFWLVMWGLLLRTELHPDGAALREVPIEHVVKLIFRHEEGSNLVVHGDGARLGQMQLVPRSKSENEHSIDCTGGLQLRMPNGGRERISWKGTVDLDAAFSLQMLHLMLVTSPLGAEGGNKAEDAKAPVAPTTTVDITVNPLEKTASYVWKNGNIVLDEQTFELNEAGVRQLAQHLGIDPGLIQSAPISHSPGSMHVTAHQSSLLVRNEKVETYRVDVEQNGQTMLELQISQLGMILQAKTIVGWTLESE